MTGDNPTLDLQRNEADMLFREWQTWAGQGQVAGDESFRREEFEPLAALKQPLVQVRGQWVVLDPDQVQAALKFFDKAQGEMTLTDALRLGLGADGEAVPPGVEFGGVQASGWLEEMFERLQNANQHY